MKEIVVEASIQNLDTILDFVHEELGKLNYQKNVEFEIDLAVEEIYVNIAHYAYNPDVGPATIRCEIEENPLQITIQFLDNGKPYNPLEREDPDINLSAEERGIGGLGIYMVKKSMTSVDYKYEDNKNILTIKKSLN